MFMCLAILLMPLMNATAKALTVDYPLAQVVWARFTGHLVAMTVFFWPVRGWRLFRTARPVTQLARSTIMFVSNWVYIAGLAIVALATASAIMFTAPLMVTALSVPLLGERVGIRRWTRRVRRLCRCADHHPAGHGLIRFRCQRGIGFTLHSWRRRRCLRSIRS